MRSRVPEDRRRVNRPSAAAAAALETGEDRLEERVADEVARDLEDARVRLGERAGEIRLGRDLVAGRVGEDLPRAGDDALVDLLAQPLVLVARLEDLQVAEDRLHVSVHPALTHVHLRVEG